MKVQKRTYGRGARIIVVAVMSMMFMAGMTVAAYADHKHYLTDGIVDVKTLTAVCGGQNCTLQDNKAYLTLTARDQIYTGQEYTGAYADNVAFNKAINQNMTEFFYRYKGTGSTVYPENPQDDWERNFGSTIPPTEVGTYTAFYISAKYDINEYTPNYQYVDYEGYIFLQDDFRIYKEETGPDKEETKPEKKKVTKPEKKEAKPKKKKAAQPTGVLLAKFSSKGKRSMNINWLKVSNVDGYDVFMTTCNHSRESHKPKKIKTIKGNKTFSYTKKGLKKNTKYKGYVKAWKIKNGKKVYVKKSPEIHALTSGGDRTFTNAKTVRVNKTKVMLKKGKSFKVKASVYKLKRGKRLMSELHAPKLRYISSNNKVASVTKSGKVMAKGKGTCKVYAFSVNGARKAIRVTVK